MDGFHWPLLVGWVIGYFIVFAVVNPVRRCPGCGQTLPRFRKPSGLREALWGGWHCARCGTLVDRFGRKQEAVR